MMHILMTEAIKIDGRGGGSWAIYHSIKGLHLQVDSSTESEAMAPMGHSPQDNSALCV